MNKLRIIDIKDALFLNPNPFKTLKGVFSELDENNKCMHICEDDYFFIQVRHQEKSKFLKINLKNGTLHKDKDYIFLDGLSVETRLYKNELSIINIRGEEVLVDVLMIDNEPQELLSFVTPNSADNQQNREIIIGFLKFLIALSSKGIVINKFSFDNCFLHKKSVVLSPIKNIKVIYVSDVDKDIITSFKNYILNMLISILMEMSCDHNVYINKPYKVADVNYYNSKDFINIIEENLSMLRSITGKSLVNAEKLIHESDRGNIVATLQNICDTVCGLILKSTKTISGSYSENRIATYHKELQKWGYINIKDEVKIPFIYDEAGCFYENIAVVKKGIFYGSIDRDNIQLLNFIFKELSWDGLNNIYIFKRDDLFGVINRIGKIIVKDKYKTIGKFIDGCAVVQSPDNNLFGVINTLGDEVIKTEYDKIEPFSKMMTTATRNGVSVVLDIFGDKI
ncbi:MAG: WG repeat-containing protein [Rikenellaceae bacterium]